MHLLLLREAIRAVLVEGKVDDLKKKYEPRFQGISRIIDVLSGADPSPTKKYLEWMIKRVENANTGRIPADLISVVDKFHNVATQLPKRDINAYKSLDDLKAAVATVSTTSKTAEKKMTKIKGAEKLFEDGDYVFLYIKDKAAAINYGKGTKWCITDAEATHFESYHNRQIKFYYVFQKKLKDTNPLYKVAFAVAPAGDDADEYNQGQRVETFDAEDNEIDTPYNLQRFEDKARVDAGFRFNTAIPIISNYRLLTRGTVSNDVWTGLFNELKPEQRLKVMQNLEPAMPEENQLPEGNVFCGHWCIPNRARCARGEATAPQLQDDFAVTSQSHR